MFLYVILISWVTKMMLYWTNIYCNIFFCLFLRFLLDEFLPFHVVLIPFIVGYFSFVPSSVLCSNHHIWLIYIYIYIWYIKAKVEYYHNTINRHYRLSIMSLHYIYSRFKDDEQRHIDCNHPHIDNQNVIMTLIVSWHAARTALTKQVCCTCQMQGIR